MDLDIRNLIQFLSYKKRIKVFIENDTRLPYVYMLYGPSWIPVLCYVLKSVSDSKDEENDDATLIKTIRLLNDSAPEWEYEKVLDEREIQLFTKILLLNFAPQLQKYFKVPIKMPSVQQFNKNEILAVFLDFLLQIWNTQAHTSYDDDDDDDDDYDDDVEEDDDDDVTAHVPVIHFSHSHRLKPILRDQIPQYTCCSGCRRRSSATMYACQPCNFILHQSCAMLPELMTLPCHEGCTLSLLFLSSYPGSVFECDACDRGGYGWVYHCKSCQYDLHVSCASKQLKIKHHMCKLDDAIHSELSGVTGETTTLAKNIDMLRIMDEEVPIPNRRLDDEGNSELPCKDKIIIPFAAGGNANQDQEVEGPKQLSDRSNSVACKDETTPSFAADENTDQESELYEEAWPKKLKHELHAHRLYLVKRSCNYYICDGCDERGQGWSYYCKDCDFDLHRRCVLEGNGGENNEDEIWNMQLALAKNQKYALAHMELKFLLTSLGDVPFQCCTPHRLLQEHLKVLLAEFEILANQAGHFTLSFILTPHPDRFTEFDEATDILMHKVEHLNENIKQYCITFSELIPMHVTLTPMVTRPIDSLFIVDSLLEDLDSLINGRFHVTIYVDMEDQIAKLYEELKLSRAFLKDTKTLREMSCFSAIREISYAAEYLIKSYVVGYIPLWYFRLRLPIVIQKLNLNRSMLQEIKLDDDVLQITTSFNIKASLQPMEKTSNMVVEDHRVGIKNSKNEVLSHLTGREKALKIISLVGMPGLGKTFLAKNLYNSYSVHNHFDARAWCIVSQNYQKKIVFLDILMTLISKDEQQKLLDMDDESLGLKIHKSLYKRRYIIVIDDIWSSSTWDDIRSYFPDDNNGSRIMLTSRIKSATPSQSIFPKLQLLSQVDSMNLLVKKVFLNKPCPQHLQDMGNKIAKRCSGLPLAVVVIAGILANLDRTENAWKKVENDLDTFILDVQDGCAKVLEFSYEHLPDHLKMCFLYLGTFPEDSQIGIGKISRLWIAEGFIERVQGKCPEDVAKEYLHDLINRSLVLIVRTKYNGDIKACGLHDLLRDLCLRKADETGFMKYTKESFSMYVRHHRLRANCGELSSYFGLHCRSFSGNNLGAASSCFSQMPLHRVINLLRDEVDVNETTNRRVLEGIDMLVHLRYLYAPGQSLSPQLVSNLVNLEVLYVSHLSDDKIELSILLKMVKLKYLQTRNGYTQIINDCNDNSCKSSNLQSLSAIKICSLEDEEWLKYFPHLLRLRISTYHSRFPNIGSSTVLESLFIENFSDIKIDFTTVIFPASIRKLTLYAIGLSRDEMSVIGRLPNLQALKLCKDAFVGEEWETMDGEFQKLRFLQLHLIDDLKQWITYSEHFPELQCLLVVGCDKLKDIPSDLGYITTLHRINVNRCSYIVSKSAIRIEEEQHEIGNEELEVSILSEHWYKLGLVKEYQEMKEVYRRLLDEDSISSSTELLSVMRSIGINPSEAEIQRISEVNGNIDFPDFLDLIAEIRVPYSENMIQKAFKFFDRRHERGFIDVSSLCNGLREFGQDVSREEVEKMVRKADIDGDGKLNQFEFNKLMTTIDVPKPHDLRTALLLCTIPGEIHWTGDIKDTFSMFDFDGDGCITTNELVNLIRRDVMNKNPSEAQIHDMLNKVDLSGDGTIDFRQFLYLWSITFEEGHYKEEFKCFDEDQNGFISADDLRGMGVKGKRVMIHEEVEEMIRECDVDGDGQLNFHEFLNFRVEVMLKLDRQGIMC